MSEMTFHDCCRAVIRGALRQTGRSTFMNSARAYAEAGLKMTDPEEIRTQALYIRVNLNYWRNGGEEARRTKTRLDEIGSGE